MQRARPCLRYAVADVGGGDGGGVGVSSGYVGSHGTHDGSRFVSGAASFGQRLGSMAFGAWP